MDGCCRLADPALMAGHSNYHRPLCIFPYARNFGFSRIQTFIHTKICPGAQAAREGWAKWSDKRGTPSLARRDLRPPRGLAGRDRARSSRVRLFSGAMCGRVALDRAVHAPAVCRMAAFMPIRNLLQSNGIHANGRLQELPTVTGCYGWICQHSERAGGLGPATSDGGKSPGGPTSRASRLSAYRASAVGALIGVASRSGSTVPRRLKPQCLAQQGIDPGRPLRHRAREVRRPRDFCYRTILNKSSGGPSYGPAARLACRAARGSSIRSCTTLRISTIPSDATR